jgi:hypothetical protein
MSSAPSCDSAMLSPRSEYVMCRPVGKAMTVGALRSPLIASQKLRRATRQWLSMARADKCGEAGMKRIVRVTDPEVVGMDEPSD